MNKEKHKKLIDEFIYNKIDDNVLVEEMLPKLTYNRFDLAFKLLFIELLSFKNFSFDCVDMYEDHIRAFSLGSFKELGNKDKNTINDFETVFRTLYNDIKNNGFDGSKSLVPLALDKSILNGAHRTSIAIYLNEKIKVLQTQLPPLRYNYDFFYKRNVSKSSLDKAAIKFIEFSENTYVAFIWPTAQNYDVDLNALFSKIVYMKNLKLTSNGAHNLLAQIYEGESWLGSIENNFKGVLSKKAECFKTYEPVRIVAFQSNSLDKVIEIKENIRKIFKKGKHSIHITDTSEEAITVARTIFNENGVHYLNYAKPNEFLSLHQRINTFENYIKEKNISPIDCLFDYNMTLALYGIREDFKDRYCLLNSLKVMTKQIGHVFCQNEDISLSNSNKNELIYNSDNYFYFRGLKFISFSNLHDYKKKRIEKEDINDLKKIETLVEINTLKVFIDNLKQRYLYFEVKFKYRIGVLLKKINLFDFVKFIFGKI